MNNIKSFNEYTGYELEQMVYDQELNEGIMGKGVRGFFNKMASGRVKSELADEIEMSKTIMEGIKKGLESLNENFDGIRDELDDSDEKKKGKNQKILDDIKKILDDSRKNTWDLNELIDEGEIDYTGFTANVGIASVAYFGILFTPFRARVMIHKGYNYFFNIIKNTIRKSLVMLQLNFDQFENLIITKSFQSVGYLQDQDTSVKISEFYGKLQSKLFDDKHGSLTGKKGSSYAKEQMQLAKQQIDAMMKADKAKQLSDNAYNCLDQYNNTYTKSLETLRQYSQDDVQKNLDSIKASMTKLAGQEVDLQTYAELITAAAEEHAYKVSSSIYNKFAKMTEVFSLPNQQKLIDLIQAATKEKQDAAEKEKSEKDAKELKEKEESSRNQLEKEAVELFKGVDGTELGDLDEETNKYDKTKIKAKNWTYEKFKELNEDDQNTLEKWMLNLHPEVLNECDETLQVALKIPFLDSSYIDSIIDYIGPCLIGSTNESHIFNFDEFIFESKKHKKKKKKVSKAFEDSESGYVLSDEEKKELDEKFEEAEKSFEELLKLIFGEDIEDISDIEYTEENKAKLEYIMSKCEVDGDILTFKKLKTFDDTISSSKKLYIDFNNIDKSQINDLKELYGDERKEVAIVALKVIGEKVLKDKTFSKNSKNIVETINKCFKAERKSISLMTYILLANAVKSLKEHRDHDYVSIENDSKNNEKSEK